MLLGCIADDFTGATDLANNLVRAGMRTVQTIGVPERTTGFDADAVVVALKSRTIEPADAVAQSLASLDRVEATFYVPNRELGAVKVGAGVSAIADAHPGRTFAGKIARVAAQAEFTPRMLALWAKGSCGFGCAASDVDPLTG